MSGGSFSYICYFNSDMETYLHELRRMVEYAHEAEGYSKEVVSVLEGHLAVVEMRWNSIQARHSVVEGLLKAVEWECSGDWGDEDVNNELKKLLGDDQ